MNQYCRKIYFEEYKNCHHTKLTKPHIAKLHTTQLGVEKWIAKARKMFAGPE